MECKIIFLDTSIFESENYFEGRNINILFNLVKHKLVQLKITDIVYREVLARLDNHAIKAVNLYKKQKIIFDKEARILRNTNVLNDYFNKINFNELKLISKSEMNEKFHSVIRDFNIEIISSNYADVTEVLKDYFSVKAPFKDGLKKNEFPDALSLNAIKNWCDTSCNSVIHLSNDKDFEGYENDKIDCSFNLSSLLEDIFTENDYIRYEHIFNESIDNIKFAIEDELCDDIAGLVYVEIEDGFYYDDVEFISIDKYDIVKNVINEITEESFSYEIEMTIFFSVQLYYTDYSSAIYDKEDSVWLGEKSESEVKKYSTKALIYVDFELDKNRSNGKFVEISNYDMEDLEEIVI